MITQQTLYYVLIVIGLFSAFFLNKMIYNNRWFRIFVPISLILIIIGFQIKEIFETHYYKLLIIPPILIYLIKLTQLGFGYFDQKYTINIRGFADKDIDMPTMDTLLSLILIGVYGLLYFIF